MNDKFIKTVEFIKELYPNQIPVPLHSPKFLSNEKKYLNECIDSTFVSYVGKFVTLFEEMTANFCGTKYAVAIVNGTCALQLALQCAGVKSGDEVITQALTFVATANAISHCGAEPVFIDVDKETMGMSAEKLADFLKNNTEWDIDKQKTVNKISKKTISAIVPMHTFGHPCYIDEIVKIAEKYQILVIEDAAESLGSYYKGKHTGSFGIAGILSYNGNKTITTGGGGMIITDNKEFAEKAKHLSTTAKIPHAWEFNHDMIAYNFRLNNLSAALGVAQMEIIDKILANKKETALLYEDFFKRINLCFVKENKDSKANYWLNAILLNDKNEKALFLKYSNEQALMCRPIWNLMSELEMYKHCQKDHLENSIYLQSRIVNIPSSVRIGD